MNQNSEPIYLLLIMLGALFVLDNICGYFVFGSKDQKSVSESIKCKMFAWECVSEEWFSFPEIRTTLSDVL